jgi:flagellar FliJ protein
MSAPRFKFSLQRVLELREEAESVAAIELASARAVAEEARRVKEVLDARRAETRQALDAPPGRERRIAEVRQIYMLMEHLDTSVARADESVASAERGVADGQARLGETVKDRRVIDRLRERQLEAWRVAGDRVERETMDDIARARFLAASTNLNPGD